MIELDGEALGNLYDWLDNISFSEPRKSFARDFADGVKAAELIGTFLPQFVQMHNYTRSSATSMKKSNWDTLNRKVLSKLECTLSKETINDLVAAKSETTETVLHLIRCSINEKLKEINESKARKAQGLPVPEPLEMPTRRKIPSSQLYSMSEYPESTVPPYLNDENTTRNPNSKDSNKDNVRMNPGTLKMENGRTNPGNSKMENGRTNHGNSKMENGRTNPGNSKMRSDDLKMSPDNARMNPGNARYQESLPVPVTSVSNSRAEQYDRMQMEMLEKEERIKNLEARVNRLDKTIELKDVKIKELESRLNYPSGNGKR